MPGDAGTLGLRSGGRTPAMTNILVRAKQSQSPEEDKGGRPRHGTPYGVTMNRVCRAKQSQFPGRTSGGQSPPYKIGEPAVRNKANYGAGAMGLRIADCGVRIEGRMPAMTDMGGRAEQSQFERRGRQARGGRLEETVRMILRDKANRAGRDQREVLCRNGVMIDPAMIRNKANWPCRADGGHSPLYPMAKELPCETKPICRASRRRWTGGSYAGNCENEANLRGRSR